MLQPGFGACKGVRESLRRAHRLLSELLRRPGETGVLDRHVGRAVAPVDEGPFDALAA